MLERFNPARAAAGLRQALNDVGLVRRPLPVRLKESLLDEVGTTRQSKEGTGGQNIGRFGSVVLVMNTLVGPGLLQLPRVLQKAGWVPVTCSITLVSLVSALTVTLFCDVLARVPRPATGEALRYEYSDLFRHVFGRRSFALTQLLFFLCNMSQAVTGIVATAQVMDSLLMDWFVKTWGFAFDPMPRVVSWDIADCHGWHRCIPFGGTKADHVNQPWVLTLGYVVTAVLIMPQSLLSLDDNIKFQMFSFVALVVLLGEFAWHWSAVGLDAEMPAVGSDWSNVLGVALFNFTLCIVVPSWFNEKHPRVSTNRTIWGSFVAAALMFLGFGSVGALSMHHAPDNVLSGLSRPGVDELTRLSSYFFGLLIIGFGVPVSCVLMRYNLQLGGVLPPRAAAVVGTLLPWLLSWPLYQGHAVLDFIATTGTLVNGTINLVLPLFIAHAASGAGCFTSTGQLRPPSESSVAPLPQWMEPWRPLLIGAMLAVVLLAIGGDLALKCVNLVF